MSKTIGWNHPADAADQWDGFNDPGIEHFAGSPVRSLAREVTQNSLDAVGANKGIVDLRFEIQDVLVSSVPDIEGLKSTIQACLKASEREGPKAKSFFKIATDLLKNKRIQVLSISDSNTKGMKGPCKNGTPYYAFMKAKGQSVKPDPNAVGSFGIGKFAPYANSKLRTIFVSTVFENEKGGYEQYTQAKSVLMSHDIESERRQGYGFWGVKDKCQPFEGVSNSIPNWIHRTADKNKLKDLVGSKLTLLGFEPVRDWEDHLAASLAENFFGAIHDGRLRIEITSKYVLDQKTIHKVLSCTSISSKLTDITEEPQRFDRASHYLNTLGNTPDVIVEEHENRELGLCELRILLGENLPKSVAVLRGGMFITDYMDGLKSFYDFKDFAAVVQFRSEKGNSLLRQMEPPKHDNFEPDRLESAKATQKGARALKELSSWVRESLKRHAKDPVADVTEVDELKDFFADEGASESGKALEEINPFGRVLIRAKPINTRVLSRSTGTISGQGLGVSETGSSKYGSSATKPGGSSPAKKPTINDVRGLVMTPDMRRLSFTPIHTGKIAVTVLEAGADSDYPIRIMSASNGNLGSDGSVSISVTAGKRVSMEIKLQEEFSGAIKVIADEI